MSEACQELMALHKPINYILDRPCCPMSVYRDNQAAISSTKMDGGIKLRRMTQVCQHNAKVCLENKGINITLHKSSTRAASVFERVRRSAFNICLT